MAQENQGILSVLQHALGLEGGNVDIVKLGRWVGTFLLFSTLLLAVWNLIDPTIGGGGFPLTTRLRLTWLAIVSPGWNAAPVWVGLAVILLAELTERAGRSA